MGCSSQILGNWQFEPICFYFYCVKHKAVMEMNSVNYLKEVLGISDYSQEFGKDILSSSRLIKTRLLK